MTGADLLGGSRGLEPHPSGLRGLCLCRAITRGPEFLLVNFYFIPIKHNVTLETRES